MAMFWDSESVQWHENCEKTSDYTHNHNKVCYNPNNVEEAKIENEEDYTVQLEYVTKNEEIIDTKKRIQNNLIKLEEGEKKFYPRKERFSSSIPLVSTTSLIYKSDLDENTLEYLRKYGDFSDAYYVQELEHKDKTIADVVDQAVEGILREGRSRGKDNDARKLAEQLSTVKSLGTDIIANRLNTSVEIGEMCVLLYTKDTFWYGCINSICRQPQLITTEKIKTIGPFYYLLETYLYSIIPTSVTTVVYRGIELDDEQRQEFMKPKVIFKSFTSASKKREIADIFGNTLLIIHLHSKLSPFDDGINCGADISSLSEIKDEEEFLIWPSAEFTFIDYSYDEKTMKHIIYLESVMNE